MLSTPARGKSRPSNSGTDTAISPPWLPSRERVSQLAGIGAEPPPASPTLHPGATRRNLAVGQNMTQKVEAVYTDGILKPTRELSLKDKQRVRLTVETIDEPAGDREAAIARLKAGITSMRFFSEGPLPSREELHDRR